MKKTASFSRTSAIQAIQTRRHQIPTLHDDDAWRDFLDRCTGGERSLRAMNDAQLTVVLAALLASGARTGPGGSRKAKGADGQVGKVRALWISLHDARAMADGSDAALLAWAARQLARPVDRLEWLPAAEKRRLIEGLKGWARRLGVVVEK